MSVLTHVFATTPEQKFSRCCRDVDGKRFVIAMCSDTHPSPNRELALPSPRKCLLLKFTSFITPGDMQSFYEITGYLMP